MEGVIAQVTVQNTVSSEFKTDSLSIQIINIINEICVDTVQNTDG